MEAGVKDHDIMYKLIIGQLYHDGHTRLALDLSYSIGMNPSPPPSDKLFRLVSAARLVEDDAYEEKKGSDVQMPPNQVVPSTDNLSFGEEWGDYVQPWSIMEPEENDRNYKQFQLESVSNQFEDDGERGDYFPILALPKELISHVFSFLCIEDRMRARVNKTLDTIELESKYHVERLLINRNFDDLGRDTIYGRYTVCIAVEDGAEIWEENSYQHMIFNMDKSYSSNCIRRLAQNVSIGTLEIRLTGSNGFNREVYSLIKEFDIGRLNITEKSRILREVMGDSFLLDLSRTCQKLSLYAFEKITPEALHQVYKIIIEGSAKLNYLWIYDTGLYQRDSFLSMIGITRRCNTLFSNREIQFYKYEEEGMPREHIIFDGFLEIRLFADCLFCQSVKLELHETQDSLEHAKKSYLERRAVRTK